MRDKSITNYARDIKFYPEIVFEYFKRVVVKIL